MQGRWTIAGRTQVRAVAAEAAFSFAGKGIQFSPSLAELEAIPEERAREYLLQQRVAFEPVIDTPDGMTQAEIGSFMCGRTGGTWKRYFPGAAGTRQNDGCGPQSRHGVGGLVSCLFPRECRR